VLPVSLEPFEEEVLRRMYDNDIIGWNYKSIEKIAKIIKWKDLAKQYKVKSKFKTTIRNLVKKGYLSDHGKNYRVASLTKLGIAYIEGKQTK